MVFDSGGNLFIADVNNARIRKVTTSSGIISTVAGTGNWPRGVLGGQAVASPLSSPFSAIFDGSGNMYVTNTRMHQVQKVDANGVITAFAGSGLACWSCLGDGGAATAATLGLPYHLSMDNQGSVYIADGNRIRKVTASGVISLFAGTGTSLGDGGLATSALLNQANSVAVAPSRDVYIAEQGAHRIRRVDTNGIISTVAGTGVPGYTGDNALAINATINTPRGIAVDQAGNIYFSQATAVRKIDSNGIITTVAGTGTAGFAGDGGLATNARINGPIGIFIDVSGNLYIADTGNNRIRKVDSAGIITTVGGSSSRGSSGDGGVATSAQLDTPSGVWVDSDGNIFVADTNNHRIRRITP